jgi:hypothetical protein
MGRRRPPKKNDRTRRNATGGVGRSGNMGALEAWALWRHGCSGSMEAKFLTRTFAASIAPGRPQPPQHQRLDRVGAWNQAKSTGIRWSNVASASLPTPFPVHSSRRVRTALVLLLAFVAGGILSPTAHRIQHALEHGAEHEMPVSTARHDEAVHEGHGSVCITTEADDPLDCDLCATRLLLSAHTSAQAPTPALQPADVVGTAAPLAPAPVPAHISIRGPPVRS